LTLFDLSAQQGNAEAYIQLGDFYYYQRAGLRQATRKKDAASFYQKAADLHHTQAIFNLGIMHEVRVDDGWWYFQSCPLRLMSVYSK
jgi:TPR repeat protein